MKTIIINLVLLFGLLPMAGAQTVAYDTTHRPGRFQLHLEQFRSYPDSNSDIIFLGNSITAGTIWTELLGLPNVRNRGISGDTTYGILERLDEVTEGNPAKVFLLIGINDISRNFPVEKILANFTKIVNRIQEESPETKIYLQTLLPVNNTYTNFTNHYNKDDNIFAVNEGIKNLVKKEKLVLVDLHPHFLDENDRLEKRYTIDGLHLNAEGYQVWARILKKYLE